MCILLTKSQSVIGLLSVFVCFLYIWCTDDDDEHFSCKVAMFFSELFVLYFLRLNVSDTHQVSEQPWPQDLTWTVWGLMHEGKVKSLLCCFSRQWLWSIQSILFYENVEGFFCPLELRARLEQAAVPFSLKGLDPSGWDPYVLFSCCCPETLFVPQLFFFACVTFTSSQILKRHFFSLLCWSSLWLQNDVTSLTNIMN